MAANPLTRRQRDVLAVIVAYRQVHGVMPTMREIADVMGINVNAVRCHLELMYKKGVLTWNMNQCRTLRLTETK